MPAGRDPNVGLFIQSANINVQDDLDAITRARFAHCHQIRILHHIKINRNQEVQEFEGLLGPPGSDGREERLARQQQRHHPHSHGKGLLGSGLEHNGLPPRASRQSANTYGQGGRPGSGSHSRISGATGTGNQPDSKMGGGKGPGGGTGNQGGTTGSSGGAAGKNRDDLSGRGGPGKPTGRGLQDGIYSPTQSNKGIVRKRGSATNVSGGNGPPGSGGAHQQGTAGGSRKGDSHGGPGQMGVGGTGTNAQHPNQTGNDPNSLHTQGNQHVSSTTDSYFGFYGQDPEKGNLNNLSPSASLTNQTSFQSVREAAESIWNAVSVKVSQYEAYHKDNPWWSRIKDFILLFCLLAVLYLLLFCPCSGGGSSSSPSPSNPTEDGTYDCVV